MKSAKVVMALVLMGVFLLPAMVSSDVAAIQRSQIVWNTGYDSVPDNLNPFKTNPTFGMTLMYEPLFGWNSVKNKLIPVIGTSYAWNAEGTNITIDLNPAAKWNDNTAVNASDVEFSYKIAMKQTDQWGGMADRIMNISVYNATRLTFGINWTDYKFSSQVKTWITGNVPIVPMKIWNTINATYCNATTGVLDNNYFKNDMFNSSFNPDWKIFSGPYEPYYRSSDLKEEIYKFRNSSWWGAGVIHQDLDSKGISGALYVGCKQISDNNLKATAFLTDQIDMFGGFYANIKEAFKLNPGIETYYGNSTLNFYQPISGIIGIAPNHLRYPMSEVWFRKAIAYSLNRDAINEAATGGYWRNAHATLVSPDSPTLKMYYNSDADYELSYDPVKAKQILTDAGCTVDASGVWRSPKVTALQAAMLKGPGGRALVVDEQVILGDYKIAVPAGWTDVETATEYWAASITKLFGTAHPTVKDSQDQNTGWVPTGDGGNFDLYMQCCGPQLFRDIMSFLGGMRGSYCGAWTNNVTRWNGIYDPAAAAYEALYQTLESKLGKDDQTDAIATCKAMQVILASQIPLIPSHQNGVWNTYNVRYWKGWVQVDNNFQDPAAANTNHIMAIKQRVYLNLQVQTDVIAPRAGPGVALTGVEIASIFGVVALISYQLIKKHKNE